MGQKPKVIKGRLRFMEKETSEGLNGTELIQNHSHSISIWYHSEYSEIFYFHKQKTGSELFCKHSILKQL